MIEPLNGCSMKIRFVDAKAFARALMVEFSLLIYIAINAYSYLGETLDGVSA